MDIAKILAGGWLKGYKTYLVALGGLIAIIIQYLAGDTTLQVAFSEAAPFLGLLFLRKGSKDDTSKVADTVIEKLKAEADAETEAQASST